MKNKINSIFGLGFLILASMACNFSFSTANLSEIKLGKDKNASGAATTFKPDDEIFAVSAINNAMSKSKVKFRLTFDKAEGAQTGAVAYKLEKEMEVEGSREIWFNFSVPGGFAPGSYKIEAVLSGEDGKELDRKTSSFGIAGESSKKPANPEKPASDETKPETDKETDEN
jgi:hypothetical protein